jgi:hypothetical protein
MSIQEFEESEMCIIFLRCTGQQLTQPTKANAAFSVRLHEIKKYVTVISVYPCLCGRRLLKLCAWKSSASTMTLIDFVASSF